MVNELVFSSFIPLDYLLMLCLLDLNNIIHFEFNINKHVS